MTEGEWLTCESAEQMGRALNRIRTVLANNSSRKLRLLAVACARSVWDRIPPGDMRDAVETADWFTEGLTSEGELTAANRAMYRYFERPGLSTQEWEHGSAVREGAHRLYLVAALGENGIPKLFTLEGWADCQLLPGGLQAELIRDVFGNPFRPMPFSPAWRTSTALALAAGMYESRDFSAMPILADALQDAGCDCAEVLEHCRSKVTHVRGCWVVGLVLCKE